MISFSKRSEYIKNPILELDADAEKLMKSGRKIIKLNRGDPPVYFKTPEFMIDAYIEALKENQTNYSRASGTYELLDAVSKRYKRLYGEDIGSEKIIATAGVTEALFFINHALMERNDRAIILKPYYPQYIPRLMSEEGKPIFMNQVMENEWDVNTDEIEHKLKSMKSENKLKRLKYMIVTNPGNPTGRVFKRDTLERIASLANEFGFLLISDEIYDEIVYHGTKFTSMSEVAEDIPHIILNGSSKNLDSTGFRVGFVILPGDDRESVRIREKLKEYALTRLSLNTPAQHSVTVGFNNFREHNKAIDRMVHDIKQRVETVVKMIGENDLMDVVMPDSTFYVFPKIDLKRLDFKNGDEFVRAALFEAGVQLTRGSAFGAPSNFRIVALPEEETLEYAMEKINKMCKKHMKK